MPPGQELIICRKNTQKHLNQSSQQKTLKTTLTKAPKPNPPARSSQIKAPKYSEIEDTSQRFQNPSSQQKKNAHKSTQTKPPGKKLPNQSSQILRNRRYQPKVSKSKLPTKENPKAPKIKTSRCLQTPKTRLPKVP